MSLDVWKVERFAARDGVELATHTRGSGRTVVMIHGFLASTEANWIAPGIADRVVDAGFRVVGLDLRGHGQSDAPITPEAWPEDVLASDGFDLIARLGLVDYDLVGYSLGARTAARMLVRGARPRRAALGGMGLSGIVSAGRRAELFREWITRGEASADPAAGRRVQAMMQQNGVEPAAMLGVLDSFAATTDAELAAVETPTLVVSGVDDDDNGSPEELAAILPHGKAVRIPGHHLSAVGAPLGRAIIEFLQG